MTQLKKHFFTQDLECLLENLKELKNNSGKNKDLVNVIEKGLKDLKEEVKDMSKAEREIEDIAEKNLEFNKQNQEGKGLKILTPNQMLSRLPVSLAQLQAGNNSQKLKN